jgi:hypothetical protein
MPAFFLFAQHFFSQPTVAFFSAARETLSRSAKSAILPEISCLFRWIRAQPSIETEFLGKADWTPALRFGWSNQPSTSGHHGDFTMYKLARRAGLFLALSLPLLIGCRSVTTRQEPGSYPEYHHSNKNGLMLQSGSLQIGHSTSYGGPVGLGNTRSGMLQ